MIRDQALRTREKLLSAAYLHEAGRVLVVQRADSGAWCLPGGVAEVGEATRTLCSKKVDAIELFGNAAHGGFASLIKVARECKTPVFSPSPFEVLQGAVASFYPDFQEGGVEAGKMIARVLKGESPAKIPFHRLETTKTVVNPGDASKLGVPIPPDVVKQADSVVGGTPSP